MSADAVHPLLKPGWVAFSLVVLAIPLGLMVFPAAPPPLPHLARLPTLHGTTLVDGSEGLDGRPMVVDITAWPCEAPCIARTATMAALAHSAKPPALLTLFTTEPDVHPAVDAAQAVQGWQVRHTDPGLTVALHEAWYTARGDEALDGGGLLVVDSDGSVRAVVPASAEGVKEALILLEQLGGETG